jgi:hypothetical protein
MKRTWITAVVCCLVTSSMVAAGDWLDRVDEALTTSAFHDAVRLRLSGALDLEAYHLQQPVPSLIYTDGSGLFTPRLRAFLDAQLGAQVYVFAQLRADRGFDAGTGGVRGRLDEYALRFSPWDNGCLSLQLGKFATVVGNWAPRHGSWESPFITDPLPYANLTGIWDTIAARTSDALLLWASVKPRPSRGGEFLRKYLSVPVIWGPSYASGAAVFGEIGRFNYACEIKNVALASRPEVWEVGESHWERPTWSGRLGYRPNPMWSLGVSASKGTYLRPMAITTVAPGHRLEDYREIVFGQDVSFAWHYTQVWAELYETRFTIPIVGDARTFAYYVEAKQKLTPQVFVALRWNQQSFSTLRDRTGASMRWGRDVWRVDVGPGYRFTPHTQFKLQYSLQHEDADSRELGHMLAGQFTVRF